MPRAGGKAYFRDISPANLFRPFLALAANSHALLVQSAAASPESQTNTFVSQLLRIDLRKSYNAIRFHNTVLDPNRPGSHHVSHDDICENSISHYNNLIWTRQSRYIAATQVIKDVDSTARLFCWMPEDFDSSGCF